MKASSISTWNSKRAMKSIVAGTLFIIVVSKTEHFASAGPKEIFEKVARATVLIRNKEENSSGSGFVLSNSQLIITNAHVVGSSKLVSVVFPKFDAFGQIIHDPDYYGTDSEVRGQVVAVRPEKDLAAVFILGVMPPDLKGLHVSVAGKATSGGIVYAIGHPADRPLWSFAIGHVVSLKTRTMRTDSNSINADMIELRSNIWNGNSGGPVVNESGKLVGVVVARNVREPMVNWAIACSEVHTFKYELRWGAVLIKNATDMSIQFRFRWGPEFAWFTKEIPARNSHYCIAQKFEGMSLRPEMRCDVDLSSRDQHENIRLQYDCLDYGNKLCSADWVKEGVIRTHVTLNRADSDGDLLSVAATRIPSSFDDDGRLK